MEQLFAPKLTPESLMKKNGVKNGVNLDCIPDWSNPSPIIVTFHKTPYAFHAHEFVEKAYDVQEFIQEFRQLSNAIVDKKNERWVFNSSIFRPNGQAEGYRRQEHFYQSSFMALDFDNGTLSAKEFERIFGQKPKRSFLLFNSFNRSPEMPNKFRVILFYKQPARSVAEHQAIFNSIEMRLESDGYPPTESGLDRN